MKNTELFKQVDHVPQGVLFAGMFTYNQLCCTISAKWLPTKGTYRYYLEYSLDSGKQIFRSLTGDRELILAHIKKTFGCTE